MSERAARRCDVNIYTAPHVSGAPDWSAVPSAEIGNLLWTESCGVRAWAQLCWTEEALRLRLRAAERDIRAEERGLLGMPCRDSCLEFFFCPSAGDLRYFNIEFSPSGCMYLGFGRSIEEHSRLLVTGAEALFGARTRRTDGGWEVAYRVPAEFVRRFFPEFELHRGLHLRGNFYKCGDATVQPHYLAWNPVTSAVPAFHRPEDFGEIVLGG